MQHPPSPRWSSTKPARVLLGAVYLSTALILGALENARAAEAVLDRIQTVIRARLDGDRRMSSLSCQGEMICGVQMLPVAYRKNGYHPLWIDGSRQLVRAESLIDAIRRAKEDGLEAQDYHLDAADGLVATLCEQMSSVGMAGIAPESWADLDLILTDAFLLYGSHLAAGRVNPETLHTDWKINPGAVDLLKALDHAASTADIASALAMLRPAHKEYRDLRLALAGLRILAAGGGWPTLDDPATLKPGDRSPAVVALRQRLSAGGDLDPPEPVGDPLRFDEPLAAAVKHFQHRSGLEKDGVVGPRTRDALNVGVDQRVQQVILNLERWRWLPRVLGARHIMVNTADFTLKAVADNVETLRLRVVVGRPARRSPVFSADMTYLVANPYWNVPTTIAVEDILPEAQKDPAYLASRGIRVFRNWDADAAELDPATIDWRAYHAGRFPFRLRQDPGPDNALGRIKFMFPNQFAVYLHDTPNRSLFNRVKRDFSSGCIRVESPAALADFVLQGDDQWTMDKLKDIFEKKETRIIRLSHPVPVHLLYMTAWVDAAGGLHFRNDIYDRDRDLAEALNQRRPKASPVLAHRQ